MSGRVILPEEIKKQAADIKHAMENIITFLSQMQDPIRTFTEADELQGQAWTAKKNQMGGYLLIIENGISAARDMIYDCSSLSTSVGEEELREDDLITMIEQQQEIKENCQYQIMAYTELDRCAMQLPDAPRFKHGIDLAHQQIERAEKLIKLYQRKLERIDEIERATDGLFESMHHVTTLMKSGLAELNNSYSGGTFHCNVNAAWRTSLEDELLLDKFDVQRPPNMKDAEWREYRKTACKEIKLLQEQGWEISSIRAYTEYINKNVAEVYTGQEAIVQLKKCNKQTQVVGSKIFRDMWYAWEIDRADDEGARKKLNTLMTVVGMDEKGKEISIEEMNAILTDHMNPNLPPDSKFWDSLCDTVQKAYPGAMVDDKGENLAMQMHLFRYVISAQQVQYIRTHYDGDSDAEKLATYIAECKYQRGRDVDDMLHQRYRQDENLNIVFPDGSSGANYKVLTGDYHSEFILNSRGEFLYIIDDSNANGRINGSSFNYADRGGSRHTQLDVDPPKVYDPDFREKSNPVIDDEKTYKKPNKNSDRKIEHYNDIEKANKKLKDEFEDMVEEKR